jgi:hypothetical protein
MPSQKVRPRPLVRRAPEIGAAWPSLTHSRQDGCRAGCENVSALWIPCEPRRPTSERCLQSPRPKSCRRSVWAKQSVRRTNRCIRGRRGRGFARAWLQVGLPSCGLLGLTRPRVSLTLVGLPGSERVADPQVGNIFRLRNSLTVELLLAVGVFGFGWLLWQEMMRLGTSTWYTIVDPAGWRLTLAGQWYVHVSIPLSQFLLYRWYFRLFVWFLLLWRVSRLDLQLTPTHPDQAGGLGFLAGGPIAFALLILAQSAFLSASIGNRILFQGASLDAFQYEIAAFVVLQILLMLGPLIVFAPTLLALKRRGRREYGVLAARYTREFHAKWIGGAAPPGEPLMGSADIQSLADLANSYQVVQGVRVVPFGRNTIIQVAMAALVPFVPLVLTVVPAAEILKRLLRMLL